MTYEDKRERIDELLEVCSCGLPEKAYARLLEILTKANSEDRFWMEIDGSTHLVLWFLARRGLLEYGSNCLGSWLTDTGWELLRLLQSLPNEEEEES